MPRSVFTLALLTFAFVSTACTAKYIDSPLIDDELKVRNTYENQLIIELMEAYERGLDEFDMAAIHALVSEDYYENAGTTDTTRDDYGHGGVEEMMSVLAAHVEEMEVDVIVRDIVVDGELADILFDYSIRTRYALEDQAYWESERDVNRLQLQWEQGSWRIISGL